MSTLNLPECPAPLKSIQHFLKSAAEHDQRDPVVSYWCRLHALQTGLKLSTKTSEETGFLLKLMDWLEQTKKAQHENEAITNEVAAQAHLENYALRLFMYADGNDRASNFGKNVIKAFYSAGVIYDVLTTFGELSEEAAQNRKYAKWKAAYIHNCLKNGETPIAGPVKGEGEENEDADDDVVTGPPGNVPSTSGFGGVSQPTPPPGSDAFGFPSVPQNSATNFPTPPANTNPSNTPYPNLPSFNNTPITPTPYNPTPTPTNVAPSQPPAAAATGSGVSLDIDQMTKAQKYVKWAGSALNYDDVPTAIMNLQKALQLLTTGQDPA